MRKSILTLGLIILLLGVFLIQQGPQILMPLTNVLGLVTYTQATTTEIAPTLLSVAPSNYTSVTADLPAGAQVTGAITVGFGKEIAFYVMDEGNFSRWREGLPSAVVLSKPYVVSGNFTFTSTVGGTYFFIFDNQDTSRRSVIFNLDIVQNRAVVNPILEFAGYEAAAVGAVLFIIGVKSGKKKEHSAFLKAEAPAGWNCKFCGETNSPKLLFCSRCGRSQS